VNADWWNFHPLHREAEITDYNTSTQLIDGSNDFITMILMHLSNALIAASVFITFNLLLGLIPLFRPETCAQFVEFDASWRKELTDTEPLT
jgi:hypothetical protein